jgi:hypothetical protein
MKDVRRGKYLSKNFGFSVDQSVQSGISHILRRYNIWKVIIMQQRYYMPKDFKPEKKCNFISSSSHKKQTQKTNTFKTFF